MAGPHYFAWCDEETAFGPAMRVEDEAIFELELSQSEGDFPSLTIEVANPRLGLLGPGRQQWCWYSWDNGVEIVPLFHGRLVGVPENLTDEVVRLLFVARPSDYPARREAVAAGLRVLPYWDPAFLQDRLLDPDTVLETRPVLWHIDRTTLDVTVSDLRQGEDGTIDVSADEHFYDGVSVSYGPQPKRKIKVTLTAGWTQKAEGEVDLTRRLVLAFQAAGSPYPFPIVSSYSPDLDRWPQPLDNLGGGWSMAPSSSAAPAIWVQPGAYAIRYTDKSDSTAVIGVDKRDALGNPLPTEMAHLFFVNWKNFDVVFELTPIQTSFIVSYAAERKRSEVATFTLSAAVQSILSDPDGTDEDTIDLSSDFIDQPVDPDQALPIGDLRRNAYFITDRGQQSLQFGMLLAANKLYTSARAVDVTFQATWAKLVAEAVSCRKSILLHDYRLPGGEALGKIKTYKLTASGGSGEMLGEVTIGCSVGYGVALDDAAGEDVYAVDYAIGYTARTGGQVAVIPGELHYQDPAGTYILDDDGVDLFNLSPTSAVLSLAVTGGPNEQKSAIDLSLIAVPVDFHLVTSGDVIAGPAIANLQSTEGLVPGTTYNIMGLGIPNNPTTGTGRTLFVFDGSSGGSLTLPPGEVIEPHDRVGLTIASVSDAVLTPDPVAALRDHPTAVTLSLVPVTGGDFLTEYAIDVLDLVIPKTIDLEAA